MAKQRQSNSTPARLNESLSSKPSKTRQLVPDQGWSWVVLFAAFFCNVTFDGIIFSFGVFYLEFLDYFGESRGVTSWIGSIISGIYAIIGPIASVLANKFGCRAVTIAGSLIACTGFMLSTFFSSIWAMMITYGVMGGIGFGLMYLCAYVMIGHYFEKHRALATGIASCGSGVGTFIFAPLSLFLIENYGWKGAMWLIAGMVLNGVVMGALFRPIPRRILEDGTKAKKKLIDWTLLKMPAFLIFCLSSFLCLIGFFIPFIYLPDFAHRMGVTKAQGVFLLSIIGITNTVGRIVCGWLSDKKWVDALKIYNGALIIGGVSTAACAFISSYVLLCIYAGIFGLCIAAYVSLCAIILVEFLGLERLSNSFGFLNMFRGIATFIGAPFAGFLFDVTGDYHFAFYMAGAAIAAAGVICLPLRVLKQCESTRHAIETFEKQRTITLEEGELQKLFLEKSQCSGLNVYYPTERKEEVKDFVKCDSSKVNSGQFESCDLDKVKGQGQRLLQQNEACEHVAVV